MNIELKNILMKFPEGIVLIDEDGEVCLKNQEFHRIFQK
jgi:transcriptional regulator with PAS, ATPase and Fis domain